MGLADSLGQQSDEGKRQALQALADAGTRGLEGYAKSQAQVQDYQNQAIQSSLAGAQARGANQGTQDMVKSIVAQPGNDSMQRLAESQGIFNQDIARRQAAVGAYFDSSKANAGLVQSQADAQIALQQQRYEQAQAAKAAAAAAKNKAAYSASELKSVAAGLADIQAESQRQAALGDANAQASARQQAYEQQQQGLHSAQEREQPVAQVIDPETAREQRRLGGQGAAPVPVAQQVVSSPAAAAMANGMNQAAGHDTSSHVAELQQQANALQAQYEQAIAQQQQAQQTYDSWALDPQTQSTRDAYAQMTGDPVLAAGLFKRQDPGSKTADAIKAAQQTMTADELQKQQEYYKQTGFKSPQEAAAWANAQNGLTSTAQDRQVAQQLGTDVASVQEARQTDQYQAAAALAQQAVQSQYASEDDVRQILNESGYPPELTVLVLADLKPQFYGSGYTAPTPAGG
jgi:hypothetical protein